MQGVRTTSLLTNHFNRLFPYSIHFGNRRSIFLTNLLPPITYLNWATTSPVDRFRQSRTPSHNRCFILPTVTSVHWHRHHRYYESIRLLASHHSGFPIRVVIPSLPQLRTIRDLPRSPNHPFVFIPTLTRHANPLW